MLRFLPLTICIILAVILGFGLRQKPDILPSPLIDKPVPAFTLPILGQENTLDNRIFQGKISLLNVWASWCPGCKHEHATLMMIADTYPELQLVGINYKDQTQAAQQWLTQHGNPYDMVAVDEKGKAAIDLGVYGTPETYVIDAKGRIRYKHVGALMGYDWQNYMLPIIQTLQQEATP